MDMPEEVYRPGRGTSSMSRVFAGVGLLFLLVGIVWILQGINVLPGSFMTGQMFWAEAGAVCVIAGAILLYLAFRPRRRA